MQLLTFVLFRHSNSQSASSILVKPLVILPFLLLCSVSLAQNGNIETQSSASESSWETIVITRDPAEVEGLVKVGEVEGRSPFFGLTAKKGEKDATKKLQQEAAKVGATLVLIVHQDNMGATSLKGIAYQGTGSRKQTQEVKENAVPKASPSASNWETIMVTRDLSEVKGMQKVGEVEGRSPFFGLTAKKGDKDATQKLQKEAASLGATKVYISHEDRMGSTTLKGIAYK